MAIFVFFLKIPYVLQICSILFLGKMIQCCSFGLKQSSGSTGGRVGKELGIHLRQDCHV